MGTSESSADPRVQRSRERVLAAAFELLSESGVSGFSVDQVVLRSGVAKTTVYRHWPTREALVVDVASRLSAEQEVPDTGSLRGDVRAFLTQLARLLTTARWASVVPSLVDLGERDPAFAEIHARVQRGHADALRAIIQRGIARGELARAADVATMVSALLGPLYYRRWFSREPLDDAFAEAIAATVLR